MQVEGCLPQIAPHGTGIIERFPLKALEQHQDRLLGQILGQHGVAGAAFHQRQK
jgi:hypothetical protein